MEFITQSSSWDMVWYLIWHKVLGSKIHVFIQSTSWHMVFRACHTLEKQGDLTSLLEDCRAKWGIIQETSAASDDFTVLLFLLPHVPMLLHSKHVWPRGNKKNWCNQQLLSKSNFNNMGILYVWIYLTSN
jgi:hypothetical protein